MTQSEQVESLKKVLESVYEAGVMDGHYDTSDLSRYGSIMDAETEIEILYKALIAREVEAALTATKTDATTELGRQIVKWKLMGVISRPNAPTQELLTGFKKVIDDRIAAIKGGENE
jgi:hypothetical protein